MTGVQTCALPIFLFVYIAPALYLVHAILTGLSLAITQLLGILHGFGFSAGLIDYLLNMHLATKGLLIIPLGLGFGALYYFIFRFMIVKFNIPTPGRMDEETEEGEAIIGELGITEVARGYYHAIGGRENIVEVDSCITRLRLTLKDSSLIDEAAIKRLGAAGVIKANQRNVQIVVGTHAELIADEMKKMK